MELSEEQGLGRVGAERWGFHQNTSHLVFMWMAVPQRALRMDKKGGMTQDQGTSEFLFRDQMHSQLSQAHEMWCLHHLCLTLL